MSSTILGGYRNVLIRLAVTALTLTVLVSCGTSGPLQSGSVPLPDSGSGGGGGAGGGGAGTGADTIGDGSGGSITGAKVTVSGKVTFSSPKLSLTAGLDLDGADADGRQRPIRGAVIEVRDRAGKVVLSSGNTGPDGTYALDAPVSSTVMIVVKAALGTPAAPNVVVVDNRGIDRNGTAQYALVHRDVAVATADLTGIDFNANTGWGGSRYTGARSAVPFAILDVVFQAQELVRAADAAVTFPKLMMNWSVNNSNGTIGTTFYDRSQRGIFILGAENLDTDEFDTHVIAHEWTHYFEDQLGRSDSLGGPHGDGDILDPTVAFGEGLANAVSGMIVKDDRGQPDPIYIDSAGLGQGETAVVLNVEANTGTTENGFWSEDSVQEVVWDLFDAANASDPHADNVDLGFKPIYQALTTRQRTTRAFTSLHSFLAALKDLNPAARSGIDARALLEGITRDDEFQTTGTRSGRAVDLYTTVVPGVSVAREAGERSNLLGSRIFFSATIPSSGKLIITATPNTSGGSLRIDFPGYAGAPADVEGRANQPVTLQVTGTPGQTQCFAIGSLGSACRFTLNTVPGLKPVAN